MQHYFKPRSAESTTARALATRTLAAAIIAAFTPAAHAQVSSTAPTVQIYGILTTGIDYVDNVSNGKGNSSLIKQQNAQDFPNFLGIRGTENLGGDMFVSFALATDVNLKSGVSGRGGSMWNKNAWVGFGHRKLGTLMFGRNDEFAPDVCSLSDMCWNGMIHAIAPGNLDRVGGAQLADMIKYASPTINNLTFKAYYSFANASAGTAATNNGRGIGAEILYRAQPVSLALTYESINGVTVLPFNPGVGFGLSRFLGTTATPGTVFALDQETLASALARYDSGRVTLSGKMSYVAMKLGAQTETMRLYELAGAYKITQPLALHAGCYHAGFNAASNNLCSTGLVYSFSKRFDLYIYDTYNRANGQGATAQQFQNPAAAGKTQNTVSMGMRYII